MKGLRRGVRHAEDKFLEPLQGIWGYACQSDRAAREEREENTSSERERGKKERWDIRTVLKEQFRTEGRRKQNKNSGAGEQEVDSKEEETVN